MHIHKLLCLSLSFGWELAGLQVRAVIWGDVFQMERLRRRDPFALISDCCLLRRVLSLADWPSWPLTGPHSHSRPEDWSRGAILVYAPLTSLGWKFSSCCSKFNYRSVRGLSPFSPPARGTDAKFSSIRGESHWKDWCVPPFLLSGFCFHFLNDLKNNSSIEWSSGSTPW